MLNGKLIAKIALLFAVSLSPSVGVASDSALTSLRLAHFDRKLGFTIPAGYPSNNADQHQVWEALWETLPATNWFDSYKEERRPVDRAQLEQLQGAYPESFLIVDRGALSEGIRLQRARVAQAILYEWGCDTRKIPALILAAEEASWEPKSEWNWAIDVPLEWPLPEVRERSTAELPAEVVAIEELQYYLSFYREHSHPFEFLAYTISWPHNGRVLWLVHVDYESEGTTFFIEFSAGEFQGAKHLGRFHDERC